MSHLPFPLRRTRWILAPILFALIPGPSQSDADRAPRLVPIEGPPVAAAGEPASLPMLSPEMGDPIVPQLLPAHSEGDKGSYGVLPEGAPAEPTPREREALDAASAAIARAAGSSSPAADRDALEEQKLRLLSVPRFSELGIDPAACIGIDMPELQMAGPPGLNEGEALKLRESIEAKEVQP